MTEQQACALFLIFFITQVTADLAGIEFGILVR